MALDKHRSDAAKARFGTYLGQLCAARNWGPADLARFLGATDDSARKYLRGDREPPLYILIMLADEFRVTLDALIRGGPTPSGIPNIKLPRAKMSDVGRQ